ncbi:MAG: type I glyceraldehyde-3-phosphate dehydrogenase [Deltaproteobacteria bacterium CG07_land_8_20_14_0_80_38_7]|nr:MAG: type I glyceraldehyde-3-phosphate dehydrogenase [Deltaproteobacteria bacterium CG07_land_8_20_14_0_80_38_7]
MTVRIAINGFGRIGRLALRTAAANSNFEFVAINDLIPASTMEHLFKYDSTHGRFKGEVSSSENTLTVNGKTIKTFSEKDPINLPWKDLKVDIVLECTGIFVKAADAGKHLTAGAKKVIISAPAKEKETATFVYGVNHETYKPSEHHVVSNASCTTNCLAPVAKVLHENFVIERGLMTTIHAYTNDQKILDAPHKDLRRARSAAVSQIPTTTGAAKAVGLVLPDLNGKLDGMSMRIPTVDVSCVDLVAICQKPMTKESVNEVLKKAANGSLKNILSFCEEPLVSCDFIGDTHSSIVDALSTKVSGNLVKIIAWYDNEIGFCHRMMDLAGYMGKSL